MRYSASMYQSNASPLTNEERERLLKLGEVIGKGVLQLVTIVSPRTYQRWQRRVSQGEKPAKKIGRKGTPESLREIVVRLAKETGWGYGRIVGELKKFRIQCVGRTSALAFAKRSVGCEIGSLQSSRSQF